MWLTIPRHLGVLAEAYGEAGKIEEGLAAVDEAVVVVAATGARHFEAELYIGSRGSY
jgi:hypothetical protein